MWVIRRVYLLILANSVILLRSASNATPKNIRARYPSPAPRVVDSFGDASSASSGAVDASTSSEDARQFLAPPQPRKNWRRVGKVQRNVEYSNERAGDGSSDESTVNDAVAENPNYENRDPIAEYTSGGMRRTRVLSPRYKSIFARSKSLKGSEFVPNNIDAYTSKVASRRKQTFMWRPKELNDLNPFI